MGHDNFADILQTAMQQLRLQLHSKNITTSHSGPLVFYV